MRPVPLLPILAFAAVAGCLGPTWYAGGLGAEARLDGTWDVQLARATLEGEGFTLEGAAAAGTRGNERAQVGQEANGSIRLWFETRLGEEVGSREEAEARVQAVRVTMEPRMLSLVGALENATGWRRSGEIAWYENVLHGD